MTDETSEPRRPLTELLPGFLAGCRWFGGKGRAFEVTGTRRVGRLPGDHPAVAIELVSVRYPEAVGEAADELYQLPLALYPEPQDRLSHAYLGAVDDPDAGPSHAYDAVHDREAMARWLDAFARTDPERSLWLDALGFHRLAGHELDTDQHSTLFSGEQSNSSVAFGEDSLMKVFRKVTPGVNPDIQIHEVLTHAEAEHVAALYGWLDAHDESSEAVIQLAMLQQFLRTASDGWDLATASVRNLLAEADLHAHEVGGDTAAESERLGSAVARTHLVLADQFPTEVRDRTEMTALAAAMKNRLQTAVGVVPELASYADRLADLFGTVADLDGVPIQRIHGDLHLGQTLRTVKGWKLVDFEGEPAKPLGERLLPDSVWRDVAGMLRSFDYAAAVVERTVGESDEVGTAQRSFRALEWARRNRSAFLAAYREETGLTPDPADDALLGAYEADKAVYECVYEARNRPTWVDVPLAGVARLLEA